MDHTPPNKMQRLSDLITFYDEDENHRQNPIPALHDFVQKIKFILNTDNEMATKDKANDADSESNTNDVVSGNSSAGPSSQKIKVGQSNSNAKVIEAFGNHVVLTEIFKCGNFRDLKNFRLVNKQWKGIANSTIIKRRLWKLNFEDKFGRSIRKRNEVLLSLNDCIEASGGSFPLTILDFSRVDDYNNFNSEAVLRFYSLIGESIKRVVFSNFGPLTMNDLQDLLFNKLPNVDHIDAGYIYFTNRSEECRLPMVLPFLRTIRFIVQYPVDPYHKTVLSAANNLKEILNFHVQFTNIVIESGKVDCIQALNIDLRYIVNYSDLYVKLSHTKPKLTSLIIAKEKDCSYFSPNIPSLEFVESLKRILISSKDTLKHLQCMSHFFPVDFELPKFPNLEFLTFSDSTYLDSYGVSAFGFPAGCDCSEIFPNVHTVSLRVGSPTNFNTLYKYFPGYPFPSVKTLEFWYEFRFWRLVKKVFPNVSHVKINDDEDRPSVRNGHIWNSRGFDYDSDNKIESLEFHMLDLACSRREFELDSLFTGATRSVCAKLLGMYNKRKARGENYKDITIVNNILEAVQSRHYMFRNSEGLRRIKITFNHQNNARFRISRSSDYFDLDSQNSCSGDSCSDEDVEPSKATIIPVITPVSCFYGFSHMPNLEEVIIGYDHTLPNASDIAQVLNPFAGFSYVKIVHEPTKSSPAY